MANIETNVDTDVEIDWTACELIEQVPGKVSSKAGICVM